MMLLSLSPGVGYAAMRERIIISEARFQPGEMNAETDDAQWANVKIPFTWSPAWRNGEKYKSQFSKCAWGRENLDKYHSGWLELAAAVPSSWGGRVVLSFDGLQCDAIVYVNGKISGEVRGPIGRVDITSRVTPGKNAVIRLWITRAWERTENNSTTDVFRNYNLKALGGTNYKEIFLNSVVAGLNGSVALEKYDTRADIDNVMVMPSYRTKSLGVNVACRIRKRTSGMQLKLVVCETNGASDGLPSTLIPLNVCPSDDLVYVTNSIPWTNPHLWQVGAAYFYHLKASIIDEKGVVDELPVVRFGFREIWIDGKGIIVNGNPVKLRMPYFVNGLKSAKFFETMGFNVYNIQPNDSFWYGQKSSGLWPTPELAPAQAGGEDILDFADEHGWVTLMPMPTFNAIRDVIGKSEVKEDYSRVAKLWMAYKGRQNRPSVLFWALSINTAVDYDPKKIGMKNKATTWYTQAESLAKSLDPTRPEYHHQGGQNGDMEAGNLYLNFIPLQEREEFLSDWSLHGEKPYSAVEFGGTPWTADFFKMRDGTIAFHTEYCAMYFGDKAYRVEKPEYVDACLDTIKNTKPGTEASGFAGSSYFSDKGYTQKLGDWTLFGNLLDLFTRNINKSFRGIGGNGGFFPWLFDVGVGTPPGKIFNMWADLDITSNDLVGRPSWVTPLYDAFK
jgi:beta-galactosidase